MPDSVIATIPQIYGAIRNWMRLERFLSSRTLGRRGKESPVKP